MDKLKPQSTSATLRIDKLLWYLRLAKSRSAAQAMISAGHIRIDGRRLEKPHLPVHGDQVITVPIGNHVRVLRIITIPHRRGPATEAQACYTEISLPVLNDRIDAAPTEQ